MRAIAPPESKQRPKRTYAVEGAEQIIENVKSFVVAPGSVPSEAS